jgi:beta-lactam-binding protein with PASTA domain
MIKNFFRLLGYFIAFLTAAAAAVYLVFYIINYDKTGEVPLLVGKSVPESSELLNKRKLLIKIIDEEYHDEIAEGFISRQEVEAGREIPVGTEVGVIV